MGVAASALLLAAWSAPSVPPRGLTPGALNPAVTPATIGATICRRDWTASMRPPEAYTERLKRRQVRAWGYSDPRLSDYEEDHLIPLDLGGAPRDPRNLWPEPRHPADGWSAARKDALERRLVRLVCEGALPLAAAQQAIRTDWRRAYARYVTAEPPRRARRRRRHRRRSWKRGSTIWWRW